MLSTKQQKEVTDLFTSVFTLSEGEHEGNLIGKLAAKLSSAVDNEEIICFATYEQAAIIAAIFFTRLRLERKLQVYLLAPVAVDTEHQGKGIGQALIRYGLHELKNRSVDIAITYGDPSFYSKVGFEALPESVIRAPLKLTMPQGWLGQSLTQEPIPTINEPVACVKEFNDPVYW
ncbi:MAG TPA: GNAT family N-acetyltransferase [Chromatiaceae bacterium]|nr:MAG: N-acetyltransferase [Thiohalocapsa sp. PB-PSB1]HBG95377.1 GNAT family N-acetyltransferase [Chromatiaceae bacterium]HCS91857.1 GNAT family N-acetyltransferase [Chromatiaceae bacterium]